MDIRRFAMGAGLVLTLAALSGCGVFGQRSVGQPPVEPNPEQEEAYLESIHGNRANPDSTIWDIFRARKDQGELGQVNKYIWNAALETLNFLPVQSVDPFSGVISTGYGTPPGGGRAYRATIYVSDPALDARSLNIALMTRSGPASEATVRALEDAILTRARQLRAQDSRL